MVAVVNAVLSLQGIVHGGIEVCAELLPSGGYMGGYYELNQTLMLNLHTISPGHISHFYYKIGQKKTP